MTKPRPFNFDEFRAAGSKVESGPRPRAFSAEDLAAARAEGVAEGRRLAMESIAANEGEQIEKIGGCLERAHASISQELARAQSGALHLARAFLEEFAAGLASAREIEMAEEILKRLIDNSYDRRAARLVVSARSYDRLQARLDAVIRNRNLDAFVALDRDQDLQPGEARLEWRGGEARRGRAEIKAALAALFESQFQSETERHHERA